MQIDFRGPAESQFEQSGNLDKELRRHACGRADGKHDDGALRVDL